jgi:hypothetical protein
MATFEAVQPLPAAIQRLEASLASARRLRRSSRRRFRSRTLPFPFQPGQG